MRFEKDEEVTPHTQQSTRPPLTVDVLTLVAEECLHESKPRHESVPRNAPALARWWIHQQEPPHTFLDRPQSRSKRDGGNYWVTPYTDRISHALRKFMQLDADFQGWIVAAREDGIFWRGEDRDQFHKVIVETEKFRRLGRMEFVKQAKAEMDAAFSKLGV